MISDIYSKYKAETKLIENVIQWLNEPALFTIKVKELDLDALRAYIILLLHYGQTKKQKQIFQFSPRDLFQIINENAEHLLNDTEFFGHLIDIFEIQFRNNVENDTSTFIEICENYFMKALNSNSLELYLQLAYRLNLVLPLGLPLNIRNTVIQLFHSSDLNPKTFTKALLLIERCIEVHPDESETCLDLVWNTVTECIPRNKCCDKCHMIVAQLLPDLLKQPKNHRKIDEILGNEQFAAFVQNGMLSEQLIVRKQTVYLLRNVIDFVVKHHSMPLQIGPFTWNGSEADFLKSWYNYFLILESFHEIQKHLIISTLEQFLEGVHANFSPYWTNMIFLLMLRHENNHIAEYAINFILKHKICLADCELWKADFYSALNSTYLFQNADFQHDNFHLFLLENLETTVEHAVNVNWKIVPLWSILKAVSNCVVSKNVTDINTLVIFLKICLQTSKDYHLFEESIKEEIFNVIKYVGYIKLRTTDLLQLYDSIKNIELLSHYDQPLSVTVFEDVLMKSDTISRETKIAFFKKTIPDVNDRLNFLDSFFARDHENFQLNYLDFEILLFDCLQEEKTFSDALLVFKSRLYSLIKPNQSVTIHSTLAAVTVLQFITNRYIIDGFDNYRKFATVKEIYDNLFNIFTTRYFLMFDNEIESLIGARLKSINAKLVLCDQLYPDKTDVAVILREALLLDGYELNLRRFNNLNRDDVMMIQSLFDWYLGESAESKASPRARNLMKILTAFPAIKCDLKVIFSIFLNAKVPIDCLFQLNHPLCVEQLNDVLIEALLYDVEVQGEKKSEYEFGTLLNKKPTYNQTVRLAAMKFIETENDRKRIIHLKEALFEKNDEIYRPRYFFNSHQHAMKLRLTQALALLFRLDNEWDDRILDGILKESNQTNVTFVTELIIAETVNPYNLLDLIDKIDGNKGMTPMFAVIYYVCCKHNTNVNLIEKCINFLVRWIFVKQIAIRSAAHTVFVRLYEKLDFSKEPLKETYKSLKEFLVSIESVNNSKGLWKWSYSNDFRFNSIDCNNLLHPNYILCEIPRVTQMTTDEIYHGVFDKAHENLSIQTEVNTERCEFLKENEISLTVSNDSSGYGSIDGNVQRKIVPFRESFIDAQLLKTLPTEFRLNEKKLDSELILVASLVSKVPNLGGIARSCEVFGVKSVVLDNLSSTTRSEFQALSKAAEKWLHFIEIKSHYLFNYLLAMKSKGYCIVGAEQTSSGRNLQSTALPRKTVLVLGHEKDGIPANILTLLDLAIEIPQFGVVRSLNVHVTAALFMWEYCKQHLIDTQLNNNC